MLKILISAYACSPNMGSEPGMAWNWCVHLANYCELHIITEGEFRDKIEATLLTLPQGANMRFYYNPVSNEVRKMCWNQGDWRFYKHYKSWQYKTYELAKSIIEKKRIDILHQLNMIGFREPGYLWKIEGMPFIWGPVDAKERFPTEYLQEEGLKTQLFIRLKNFITKWQLRNSQRVSKAVKKASFVVSASSNSMYSFKKYFGIYSPLINETGCNIFDVPEKVMEHKDFFDVLWVGKIDIRKQLALAIKSLSVVSNKNIRLHIVGSGDDTYYKRLANHLNVLERCFWHGIQSHSEVQDIMQANDILLFTSVAEGTPHVVLEAIGNRLPVLCFDTCGQGDAINDSVGRKIKLSSPEQSAKEFAVHLDYLASNRELLKELSQNCKERQLELSWDKKAKQMVELYQKCLKPKTNLAERIRE